MAERTSRAKSRKPRRSDDNYVDLLERSGIRVPKGLTRNMIEKLYEANADKMHNRSRSRSPLVSDGSEPARDSNSNETTVHSDTPSYVIPDLSLTTGASSLSSTENVNSVISICLNTLNTTIQAFNSTVEKMCSQGQSITSSVAGKNERETFPTLEGLYSKNPHMAELMTSPTTVCSVPEADLLPVICPSASRVIWN